MGSELHDFARKHKLTVKQAKFCLAYTGNGTQAARSAGYAHPAVEASKLLKLPKIIQALDRLTVRQSATGNVLTRNDLMSIWSELATDSEATWKDRLKAMDSLAKAQAIYIDRSQVISNVRIESLDKLTDRELLGQLDDVVERLASQGVRLSIPHVPEIGQESEDTGQG